MFGSTIEESNPCLEDLLADEQEKRRPVGTRGETRRKSRKRFAATGEAVLGQEESHQAQEVTKDEKAARACSGWFSLLHQRLELESGCDDYTCNVLFGRDADGTVWTFAGLSRFASEESLSRAGVRH